MGSPSAAGSSTAIHSSLDFITSFIGEGYKRDADELKNWISLPFPAI